MRDCKKCLIRELADSGDIYQKLRELIDNLDAQERADDIIYENRLAVCKECDMLLGGMCRSCGCYVELRAAIGKNQCPREKW